MLTLKAARVNKNLTQAQVANLLNISIPTYAAIEQGKADIKLRTAFAIIKLYDLSSIYDIKWPNLEMEMPNARPNR